MSTSATPQTNPAVQVSSTRQQLLDAFDRETATTQKVLRAYPSEQSELKPHPRLRTARELAWMFCAELNLVNLVLRNEFKMPMKFPPTPATWEEVVGEFDRTRTQVLQNVLRVNDEQLAETTQFITGPKQIGDMTKSSILWFLLHDQIHHRGQLTVYLRMADGKVPSIYGPSADEPWN